MADVLTRKNILTVLERAGFLSGDQVREFNTRADLQSARLSKHREKGGGRGRASLPPRAITTVELLASFQFTLPNAGGEILTEERIIQSLAEEGRLPYFKIDPLKLDAVVVTLIPKPFSIKHTVVPIGLEGDLLTVATADPFDQETLEEVAASTRYRVRAVVSTPSDILKVITEFHGFRSSVSAAEKELEPQIDLGNLEQFVKLRSTSELEATDKHVVKAVEYMLQYAYDLRASDIHIEPRREFSQVRFRIDGALHDVHRLPKVVHTAVVARIKTLARMDIAEKRRPQDGRIKTHHKDREIELRVSTLPVAFGEKTVIRIFDPDILMQPFESLGFYPREFRTFESFLENPHGLILVTGPTGSGKTTTLYSALKRLAKRDVNVTTIEDPIEMIFEGFNQVGIQPQAGINFSSILRTILRQDPDIIMVGEIRDLETAENVVQAALTGHLVLSTLHTNDAPSAITRLKDIGLPPFLISATLIGVLAQRLVRTICAHCEEVVCLKPGQSRSMGLVWEGKDDFPIRIGRGCVQCRGTGYKGRTGIHEIMNINDEIRSMITNKEDLELIRALARQDGMISLRECAIKKMLDGVTSHDEVVRVTGGR
jgi:general secretion pathway protein E